MARVLMMSMTAPSHINSRVAVVQQLIAMGHQVGWLCSRRPDPRLVGLGVDVLEIPTPATMSRTTGEARMQMVDDHDAELAMMKRMFLGPYLDQVEAVREIIRGYRPDVVGLDGGLYHHVVATQLETIPWATMSSGLWLVQPSTLDYPMQRWAASLLDERLAFFARYDMRPEFRLFECVSPYLNVIATTSELVGETAVWPPSSLPAGSMIPAKPRGDEVEFPWHRLKSDRPIVYLALGTGFHWNPELIRAANVACMQLGAQLVAAVMDLAEHESIRSLPGDPVIVSYVPQLEMLGKVDAFITHGGAGSVMEASSLGVPMVVVPISIDQPVQAYFVDRAGSGVAIQRGAFTAEACRAALATMLARDSAPRARAAVIRDSYKAAQGPLRTAERLLALVGADHRELL